MIAEKESRKRKIVRRGMDNHFFPIESGHPLHGYDSWCAPVSNPCLSMALQGLSKILPIKETCSCRFRGVSFDVSVEAGFSRQ